YFSSAGPIEHKVASRPKRTCPIPVDGALDCVPVDPFGNPHGDRLGRFVANNHSALIGQVTVDIQPGTGAVQEQIDLRCVALSSKDRLPAIVEAAKAIKCATINSAGGCSRNVGRVGKQCSNVSPDRPFARIERTDLMLAASSRYLLYCFRAQQLD